MKKTRVGDIEYHVGGFFERQYWTVVDEIRKDSQSSAIFHNFERARLYSIMVQIAHKLKRK